MITRVWGKADSFALEFSSDEQGVWNAKVPGDFEDGQYAVEIHVINHVGYTAYWTGTLFISDGKVCCHIQPPEYIIWVKAENEFKIELCNDWNISVAWGCDKNGRH